MPKRDTCHNQEDKHSIETGTLPGETKSETGTAAPTIVGRFLGTQERAQRSMGRIQAQRMVGYRLACQRLAGQRLAGQRLAGQRLVSRMTQ